MNFGTGRFFLNLLDRLIEKDYCKEQILKELRIKRDELEHLTSKVWGMTDNTAEAISLINELVIVIENDVVSDFQIERLKSSVKQMTNQRVKVLFLIQEVSVWPSIESVFWETDELESMDSQVVYLEFLNPNFRTKVDMLSVYMNDYNLPIIPSYNYNLKKESPDIVFLQKPYNTVPRKFWPEEILACCERVVYIPYGMELNVNLIKYGFQYPTHYKVWKHIVYSNEVEEYAKRFGYRGGKNVCVLGHPKADAIRIAKEKGRDIPKEWKEKIYGRKVILWTPHHLVGENDEDIGTWNEVKDCILNYFYENHNIVLLFRPHPLLLNNLVKKKYHSRKEIDALIERMKRQENIIVDEEMDYRYAFMASDAIITDPTTFSFEYIYTGKPTFVTIKNPNAIYCKERYLKAVYSGLSEDKIAGFIDDVVLDGADEKQEQRIAFRSDELGYDEGMNVGEKIIRYLEEEYFKEIENAVNEVIS